MHLITAGLMLESKGMGAIFQEKGKEMLKEIENFGKNVLNLKIFLKKGRCLHSIIKYNELLE